MSAPQDRVVNSSQAGETRNEPPLFDHTGAPVLAYGMQASENGTTKVGALEDHRNLTGFGG